MTPPHGDDLPAADRLLLRGQPPARALRWCGTAAGPGATLAGVRALEGGTSSAVHAVDVRTSGGRVIELVLRRFVRADWLAREPQTARREAEALELVAPLDVPTPELVAVDPDGSAAGDPAVLATRLAGRHTWNPPDLEGFLRELAALLPVVHAGPLPPAGSAIGLYSPYALRASGPPARTRRPALWDRAFALFAAPPPSSERRLLHRDFHPGNVLWSSAGAVSGLVDWVNASVGPPAADVGHCRMNLARAFGVSAAERFLALADLADHHPYWDVVAALGDADDAELAGWTRRQEDFLAAAVARC